MLASTSALVQCRNAGPQQSDFSSKPPTEAFKTMHLDPANWKALYRKAEAQLLAGEHCNAWSSCQEAARLTSRTSCWNKRIQGLMDHIAVQAAAEGCLVGFPGRLIEVRPAGFLDDDNTAILIEDAAPAVLDAAPRKPPLPAPRRTGTFTAGEDVALQRDQVKAAFHTAPSRSPEVALRFGRLHQALEVAKDGDIIVLTPGTHYIRTPTLVVQKRILICSYAVISGKYGKNTVRDQAGAGATCPSSGQVPVLDHRSNSPLFRIQRSCCIQGLELDMCGFRECVLVGGDSSCQPVVKDCSVKCSGSDAVNVCETGIAHLINVHMQARKSGLRAFDSSKAVLQQCHIEGHQGVTTLNKSSVRLTNCKIRDCGMEAIMAMEHSKLVLEGCHMSGDADALVDLSGKSSAQLKGCEIVAKQNAILVWEQAKCKASHCSITSHQGHAVFLEQCTLNSLVCCKDMEPVSKFVHCRIDGVTSPAKLP